MSIEAFVVKQSQRFGAFLFTIFALLFMLNGASVWAFLPIAGAIGLAGYYAAAMGLEWHYSRPVYGYSPAQTQQHEAEQDTVVQPVAADTPTAAPLTVRMVAPPVREKPRVNGNHLRLLIDAMNEGRVDPNAVSLNSLAKAGVTRFNNGGGADSDAGQLLAYLIEKEAVTPYGQAYAAKQQPYIWRGLDIEL
jgi:hypothetical protein